jgi:hypothetical protein
MIVPFQAGGSAKINLLRIDRLGWKAVIEYGASIKKSSTKKSWQHLQHL